MGRVAVLALAAAAALLASDYSSAKRKIDLIEKDQAVPGSRVVLSAKELLAYAVNEAPEGVRDVKLQLGEGEATASATIDFLKVRQSMGEPPPSPLMAGILEGERPVAATVKLSSGNGRATVDVESVQVSGVTLNGKMLDFLLKQFVLPSYPQAKIGEPFEMGHRIERIEVHPAAVTVFILP